MLNIKKLLWQRAETLFLKRGVVSEQIKQAALKELLKKFPAKLVREVKVEQFETKTKTLKIICPHPYLASQLRFQSEALRRAIAANCRQEVEFIRIQSH